ncbi:MAG: phage tail protein, partial [Bryobacteraceae bacterium]
HGALLVADAASGRVRGFSWGDWAETLGWIGFATLSDVEAGGEYVYVVHGDRVDQLTIAGDRTSFGDQVAAGGMAPSPVTAALDGDRVFVRNASGAIVAFTTEGEFVAEVAAGVSGAGLAAARGSVYAGDGTSIAVFRRHRENWVRAGVAEGFTGPVAALACDAGTGLWVHPGDLANLLRLEAGGAYAREGMLWSAPLSTGLTVKWHRLEAFADLPAGAMIDIAYVTGPPSPAPPVDEGGADPFPSPPWQKPGQGLTDFYLGGPEANNLWIGVRFLGDGVATPELRQLLTEHDHEGYLPYLPEIYRDPSTVDVHAGPDAAESVARLLALFESMFGGVERSLDELAAWLHPQAAPEAVLGWLESFLGLESTSPRATRRARERIRNAFAASARRGTPAALREAILTEAGVNAVIEEPILQTSMWSLSDAGCPDSPAAGGLLGLDTVLAGSEAQGAVIGTTAVADRSHLISDEEFASPLFDEVAYRFAVRVYAGELKCASTLDRVRAIVEREKPAHTLAALCITEPRMRIGFQSTLGVDSLIGGGDPDAAPLGEGDLVLAGPPAGRVGETMMAGITTRL